MTTKVTITNAIDGFKNDHNIIIIEEPVKTFLKPGESAVKYVHSNNQLVIKEVEKG